MRRAVLVLISCLMALLPGRALASPCYAFVENVPGVRYAQIGPIAASDPEVEITYVGHSSFRIETAEDVVIVTDYFGANGQGRLPDIVTMNKANENHFSSFPDPEIPHVLRGWNPKGDGPAEHRLELRDTVVRNVTTDLRGWGTPEKDGNSIFVFEVAGLCIGHLGHLHHEPTEAQYALLGKLDIVMAPVDGSFTLAIDSMVKVLKRLKAQLVLPMHSFGPGSLSRFLDGMRPDFVTLRGPGRTIRVSRDTLPSQPTVMVLPTRFNLLDDE